MYHFKSTSGVIDGATMTRPQFDAWLKIHTPIERAELLSAPAQSPDDDLISADDIRELAEPLGLQMIWENGKVILYWPHEVDDIEQMDLLSYGAAMEWLKWEAKAIKQERDAADPAHVAALEEQIESGDQIPEASMIYLSALDASLPADLEKAGYYWQSSAPPIIAHNDGWRGEAPTPDQALGLARDRERRQGEPLTVFPALSEKECKALIREARDFIERGLSHDYPTFGKALRIAARMALEATELWDLHVSSMSEMPFDPLYWDADGNWIG